MSTNVAPRSVQPVAITGMACRFPNAPDIPAFWRLLDAGEDAVTEGIPGSGVGRIGGLFPDTNVQNEACRFGAYLDEIDLFDAAFFHISPVEAQLLDPQQRLMLETSWRALEDAGIDPDRLKGSRTGVYGGISNNEYRSLIMAANQTAEPAASLYTVCGTSFNTAVGRVAFALGLEGPAMALDTACSSSLVAIHQAVLSLQSGEADLMLAGGVHTILSGRLLELRGNAGMLSPDGRCKTFDASANGYVRGEGCGIVALKRLEEAEADGDRIWAIIRGSAINQDGASPGLTVPSGPAQERVIETALERAGVRPAEVDYLEAHGTGTIVGDPIEIQAAGAAYGKGRPAGCPLFIGSVKTNFGHLESAAGVAGLIKVVLAMQHRVIPKHLHFRNPNPQMDWNRLPLQVASEPIPWPLHSDRPALAGVSGFGWSGTNAHVIVESYRTQDAGGPPPDESRWAMGTAQRIAVTLPEPVTGQSDSMEGITPRKVRFLPMSGRSDKALRELAQDYLEWLDRRVGEPASADAGDALLSDMAWTAGVGRSHFSHRAGVVFQDLPSLRKNLAAFVEAGAETGTERQTGKLAFAFTGQASQWVGMGKTLYESEPVVRAVLDRCENILRENRGASLLDIMFGRRGTGADLDDPAWKQPAIYALECALTALWSSIGIRPDVVVGHSLGEIAAAQAAGVFSLEEGLLFAAQRGELVAALPGKGAMAAVFAPESRVEAMVDGYMTTSPGAALEIAADNGAHQVVSGSKTDIDAILERFEAEGVRVSRLRTSPAYHSVLMEPVLDELETAFTQVTSAPPAVPFISSMTGQLVESGEIPDGTYWRQQVREPVKFNRCVATLADLGVNLVVEIGPHAVLGPMTTLAWPESAQTPAPVALSSLLRPSTKISQAEADHAFTAAVARVYETGLPLSFTGLFAGEARRRISLPGYPFQRERYWVEKPKRQRTNADHPLLGQRHESARGEISFETELFPSDPAWLSDHRVFDRLVAPGALYGAMVVAACAAEGTGSEIVEDLQLHNPLILPQEEPGNGTGEEGRKVQVLLDNSEQESARRIQLLSRGGGGDEEEWTLHAEARVLPASRAPKATPQVDLEDLKIDLSQEDLPAFYRAKAGLGINLGQPFRTLEALWSGASEALGEVVLQSGFDHGRLDVHPLLLDGCFQVMAMARSSAEQTDAAYLPFGCERLWFSGPLPERVICHARMKESKPEQSGKPAEVLSGDLHIYDPDGVLVGEMNGYTVKRATREALLSEKESLDELLYEVVWRDRTLPRGIEPANFLPGPARVAGEWEGFSSYLVAQGVDPETRPALMASMGRAAQSFALSALDELGWERRVGDRVESEDLRQRLEVMTGHKRLFLRMLEMLARSGILRTAGEDFIVVIGSGEPLPEELPNDPTGFATGLVESYPHASQEIGIFQRSASALARVLRGQEDPLSLLFGSGEPSAADLYFKAPTWRAANRMLGDAVQTLVAGLPDRRQLRVIEVGAGTGSATESVLPELPAGRFDYTYTDISAGFFAEAEGRFGDGGGAIEYRVLDIEKDPMEQGFASHGYDLLIASNVLHATRYLDETLTHCRELLAPSGQLVALENLCGRDWQDLTFGQLDGWWRFADACRPQYALAGPAVWRHALGDAGFEEVEILGMGAPDSAEIPDRGVILARGPALVMEYPGTWILAADRSGTGEKLAEELATRNQTVVVASNKAVASGKPQEESGVVKAFVETARRESWRSLLEALPADVPLNGVVHLSALDGHGAQAKTEEMEEDVKQTGASALALLQAITDADVVPAKGVWFVTLGAQVLEKERVGELAGAILWGFGKVVAREASHLQPRMIDLDPGETAPKADLANELLYPDPENHIAYRDGRRRVARLVRAGAGTQRLTFPDGPDWALGVDEDGALAGLQVERPVLEPKEVRVAVEAAGLNFWDIFAALGLIDEKLLGTEMCGRILEIGSDVSTVAVGDRVVGMKRGTRATFGPETVTREELVASPPPGIPATALATIPTVFVTAALSFELAALKVGERVLVHAGAGGVGLAAIQLAQAAGAEVFATASAPKQAYLLSLGVKHVFDSRQTTFGREILEATAGAGVDVILNSLTAEGFIEASLSCLATGGRFVELAARDILSEEEMAAVRPDVAYFIVKLDAMKEDEPERPGAILKNVVERLAAGELTPLIHSNWPLAEAGSAVEYMRDGRHIGKIVLTNSPLTSGRLRKDRTYLVTGGLGGIGCAVAGWLADHGAGTIVLNGRRAPDPEVEKAINKLRERGVDVQVELADVTDTTALDGMLARIDHGLPALGGVIHSVGVLSDGAIGNQSWERFEQVLRPKVIGAWHLHRATMNRDLDMFVLFSSVAGILGNPGQSNHAAANAFLDQLAAHRRALGLPGQAIAWGAWSGLGEAEEQRERISRQLEVTGIEWISPQQGLKAFERLVREDVTTAVVQARDWSVFEETGERVPALLEDLLSGREADGADSERLSENLLSRLRDTPAQEHEELFTFFLQQEVQAVLRLSKTPPFNVGFFDLGMDSLMAVELRNRLNRAFSGEYTTPNTVVFDYPDIATLARHLAAELGQIVGAPVTSQVQPGPKPQPTEGREDEGIAIIGMACRFPGAPDISSFWRRLEAGADAVTDGRQYSNYRGESDGDFPESYAAFLQGAFVEDIDKFDARFFRISPIAARTMDPQQRMLLETSWQALEDAGIDPERLRGSRTGVYAGINTSEYRDLMLRGNYDVNYLGTAASMAIGRVSFQLGLEGPAMPVELNCSSSLVALHYALSGLRQGDADLALVGGVNATLSLGITREMADLGMLSRQGRCKAFDASADGFVRGEGCGMVVLKRLADAEGDGDRIWGVVRGSAINQNGASAGPTAAKGPAQERVIEAALERAGVEPADVDYLEAHGAGSELGDPLEVQAAAAVYGRGRAAERPLLIGSVKTNIGHLEPAAGIASLVKTVLAMNRGLIPKHLHFENPTPHLDWEQLPVRVTSEAMDWPAHPDRPRRAGVSAFGISGTNAHVVVEGYTDPPAAEDTPRAGVPRFLPLSGKTGQALKDLACRYLSWLDERIAEASSDGVTGEALADMAWTASVGRSHFTYRKGIVFNDAASLREGLEALAQTDATALTPVEPSGAYRASGDGPEAEDRDASAEAAAQAYEAGETVTFAELFAGENRRRIPLPGYPFQRRRYWIDKPGS